MEEGGGGRGEGLREDSAGWMGKQDDRVSESQGGSGSWAGRNRCAEDAAHSPNESRAW